MDKELIDSIKKMIPNGNRLELPTDIQFANYPQVKKCLLNAGGKYNKCGFIFSEDGEIIQARLVGGEAINDKKKFQFFATPTELAEQLVRMAGVTPKSKCLEPSAGQGAISNILVNSGVHCVVVELMEQNVKALKRQGYENVVEADFLTVTPEDIGTFDTIIANPPFTKNQDIEHIKHMYDFLDDGGCLVSMASRSWVIGSQKKQVAFKKWLDEVGAYIEEVPEKTFKSSGTNIATVIVKIIKD